jgi:hypothetical protein
MEGDIEMFTVDFDPVRHDLPEDMTYTQTVPQRVLDRHGARILDPATALVAPGDDPPRSTVYRWGVLLVSDDVARDLFAVDAITQALAEIGLRLELSPDGPRPTSRDDDHPTDSNLMRTVVLEAVDGFDKPLRFDAWYALQHLQTAARRTETPITRAIVNKISMDILLFSAPITTLDGAPNEGSGLPGIGYYGREPNIGHLPVALVTDPPPRSPLSADSLARRPVIAVLDTGIRAHPWLGTTTEGTPPPPDGFLKVWPQLQIDINAANQAAENSTHLLDHYWDKPMCHEQLIGTLDSAAGHGTFIVGLIRQAAPDADVLAIRVMGSDGIARGAGVLRALQGVLDRVRAAQEQGNSAEMIDIVSMSMTFFTESDSDVTYKAKLTPIIEELACRGVLVVAAAGNHSTTRKAFPAAYATELAPQPDRVPVTSVGAYNPNGTKAIFSNEGSWVTCFATGAGLVSTYPTDFRGSLTSVVEVPALNRSAYDFDDFGGYGFAIGTGTSFATPLAAAALANALIEVAKGTDNQCTLTTVDKGTTVLRALSAVKNLHG